MTDSSSVASAPAGHRLKPGGEEHADSPLRRLFLLEVLTPDGSACKLEAISVIFPAVDGYVGVLGGRAPLVAALAAGGLVVQPASGEQRVFYVSGGFAHVREGGMTILAEECVPVAELDVQQAWDALERARQMPAKSDQESAARHGAIAAGRTKFSLAQQQRPQASQT